MSAPPQPPPQPSAQPPAQPARGHYPPHPQPQGHPVSQPRNGLGTAGFVLGLLAALFAMIPLIGVIAWPLSILGLVFGIIGITRARSGVATNKGISVAGTVLAAAGLVLCIVWAAAFSSAAGDVDAALQELPAAPVAPGVGTQLAIGETWTLDNGNTIVAGQPEVTTSESPLSAGESVIWVPITLTNNGDEAWSTVLLTFAGTLDGAPVQESPGEGDFLYSTPLAPGASVTLTKVFQGGPGEFVLTVTTPQGVAFFSGQA